MAHARQREQAQRKIAVTPVKHQQQAVIRQREQPQRAPATGAAWPRRSGQPSGDPARQSQRGEHGQQAGGQRDRPFPRIAAGEPHLAELPGDGGAAGDTGQAQRQRLAPAAPPSPGAGQHEHDAGERRSQPAQPPARHLDHRPGHRELRPRLRVENAPIAAHRAFQRAFPRLVERLDHVVRQAGFRRVTQEVAQVARLIHHAGAGPLARAAGAGPAGSADHHALAGECLLHLRVHRRHVLHRLLRRHRLVFPVRQDVDGQVVHRVRQFRMTQPELQHVGIGHRLGHRCAHLGEVGRQLCRRQLAAQQYLVAHDHRAHHVRVRARGGDAEANLLGVGLGIVPQPDAQQHLHAVAPGDLWHGAEALPLRIGAHAIEAPRQRTQIRVDAFGADEGGGVERRFAGVAKRRVRHAGDARGGRIGQVHRPADRPPAIHGRQRGQQQHQPRQTFPTEHRRSFRRHAGTVGAGEPACELSRAHRPFT
ncbi:hypothetical protein RLIN73S_05496 [Rhodanobacter lindaniclasticus]